MMPCRGLAGAIKLNSIRLGQFWQACVGNFSRAPKHMVAASTRFGSIRWPPVARIASSCRRFEYPTTKLLHSDCMCVILRTYNVER